MTGEARTASSNIFSISLSRQGHACPRNSLSQPRNQSTLGKGGEERKAASPAAVVRAACGTVAQAGKDTAGAEGQILGCSWPAVGLQQPL